MIFKINKTSSLSLCSCLKWKIFEFSNFDSDDPDDCYDQPFFDDYYSREFSHDFSDADDDEPSYNQNNNHKEILKSLEIQEFFLIS